MCEEDSNDINTLLFLLKRLAKLNQPRMFDLSKDRDGNDIIQTIRQEINVNSNLVFNNKKIHNTNELVLNQFCIKLITHFNICFMHKKVMWLCRIKKPNAI